MADDGHTHRRVLVVDDNTAIHEDFRKILGTGLAGETALMAARTALFGHAADSPTAFQIDTASQGQEGVDLVRQACADNRPYALAFIDMRMPPGWDGVETATRLWEHDPDMQVVICSAYSDYSWEEILGKLGRTHRLLILKKPFENIEVLQLANALTEKWRLNRQARLRIAELERSVTELTRQLQRAAPGS